MSASQSSDHILDTQIIELPHQDGSYSYTCRQAVEGIQIFGGIGSGKTSGSGRMFALKYLKAGFGGLVLTAKPDEKDLWVNYCKLAGRSKDLVVLEPGSSHHFNFLEYESLCSGPNAATENIVEVLKTVIRSSDIKDSGKADEKFWENALDMLLFNVIDLCKLAYKEITLERLFQIAQSIPKPEVIESRIHASQESSENKAAFTTSYNADRSARVKLSAFDQAMRMAKDNCLNETLDFVRDYPDQEFRVLQKEGKWNEKLADNFPNLRLLFQVDSFFTENYIKLNERTRSIIDFSFSGFLFRLLKEPVYSCLCRHKSNITPEDCLSGKIILLNLPVKLYQKVGRDSQILFKYIWQRAMERRNISQNGKPVFLWADEAQNFLHEHDADYQATARSSRIATVYISQNLPNYYANMGGSGSEHRVKSFLGTLGTKIFHANADTETNEYASGLIGQDFFEEVTKSRSTGTDGASVSESTKWELRQLFRPEEFYGLKTGGGHHNHKVYGLVHLQSIPAADGLYHFITSFNQTYTP